MKMIVCADGSDTSKKAIRRAAWMNELTPEAEITVICVYEDTQIPPHYGNISRDGVRVEPEGIPLDIDEVYIKQKEKVLKEAVDILREMGTACSTRLLYGEAAKTIVTYAQENECDLLIIGSKGRSRVEKIVTGSVSGPVVQEAPCDVLVVK